MTSGGDFEVQLQHLKRGASQLGDVADRLNEIQRVLQASLQAEGESWGTDKPGATHASGYDSQSKGALDATENRIDTMLRYVDAIEQAADCFAETEDANRQSFG